MNDAPLQQPPNAADERTVLSFAKTAVFSIRSFDPRGRFHFVQFALIHCKAPLGRKLQLGRIVSPITTNSTAALPRRADSAHCSAQMDSTRQ
jgi:hypothetical protein